MDFTEKVKGFLLEPSKTFDAIKGEDLGEAIKYYAVIAAVYSAIFAVLFAFVGSLLGSMMGGRNLGMMLGGIVGAGGAIVIFVLFIIFAIIGAFVGGAVLHIFVYIVGGRKGIAETIKAVMYGSTPGLLLGWIPVIGFIAGIWSLVLEILGIRQLHEISTGKAVLAVVLLLIVVAVLVTVILAAVIAAFTFGGMGTPYGRGY